MNEGQNELHPRLNQHHISCMRRRRRRPGFRRDKEEEVGRGKEDGQEHVRKNKDKEEQKYAENEEEAGK